MMEPKPCPKCKSDNTFYSSWGCIMCHNCEFKGPAASNKSYAIEAWNALSRDEPAEQSSKGKYGELVEKMANQAHISWSGWTEYMLLKRGRIDAAGNITIANEWVERWIRQIKTPYAELSEQEKESDRVEAREYLKIILQVADPQAFMDAVRELTTLLDRHNKIESCFDSVDFGSACIAIIIKLRAMMEADYEN